jgi:hypothetical protein
MNSVNVPVSQAVVLHEHERSAGAVGHRSLWDLVSRTEAIQERRRQVIIMRPIGA